MKFSTTIALVSLLGLVASTVSAQEMLSLRECLDYAVEHNLELQKDKLSNASARQSVQGVVGGFMPQVSASAGIGYNIRKTTIAMPNFVNSMLPEAMRDPNAPKYMTVTMGMDYNANWGATLSQQIVNFQLFNALDIARLGVLMSETEEEIDREELVAQVASLYYSIQVLGYAVECYGESIALMDKMSSILEANAESGLSRSVDVRQIDVNRTNLESEKESVVQAIMIQKNLLKFRMGFPVDKEIVVREINVDDMEAQIFKTNGRGFHAGGLLTFRMFRNRQKMLDLQYRAAVYETLPTLSLGATYSMNYIGDSFSGETFRHFPVSAVTLNFRLPIFTGLSKTANIRKAKIERQSSQLDEMMLTQSLSMAYGNALSALEQNYRTMESQKRNREIARELFNVMERNYTEGLAPLSDLLNADAALVRSQMNYVNALGGCMKAYIELKKAEGTINEIAR